MNKEHDFYYYTLGLRPGASPAEIKAAYRRLVKLYHPDRDQSLDAEVKYGEIRAAYKALIERPLTGKTGPGPVVNRNSTKHTTWTYEDETTKYHRESGKWTFEDEAKKYHYNSGKWTVEDLAAGHHYDNGNGTPLEWKNLLSIFRNSLKGPTSTGGIFVTNGLFALIFTCVSCSGIVIDAPMQPFSKMLAMFYIMLWVFFIFVQYYSVLSAWTFFINVVAVILYVSILIF